MGPTFLVFLNVLFLEKRKGTLQCQERERRHVSFAMVMDALVQAWNEKGAVMTVTVEMWKNSPMRVGLGVGDGELHLGRRGRSTRNVGVVFFWDCVQN